MTVFYQNPVKDGMNTLSEEESRHCALVLRKKVHEEVVIYDGHGGIHQAVLTKVSKAQCQFEVLTTKNVQRRPFSIHLAIAPTKNADRVEWMVEKCCEIGVETITFIETSHSERRKLRLDRLEKKAISAMKQSGNPFLMQINAVTSFNDFLIAEREGLKYIAHVSPTHIYFTEALKPSLPITILIGPEGDFSEDELTKATAVGYEPVSLGNNTLRTETAGFMACCIVNVFNQY